MEENLGRIVEEETKSDLFLSVSVYLTDTTQGQAASKPLSGYLLHSLF